MTSQIHTHWSAKPLPDAPTNDMERHELFAKYARSIADQSMPWLFPLLDSGNAKILTAPGVFCFCLDLYPGLWFDVPEMIQKLQITPWVTEEDTPQ